MNNNEKLLARVFFKNKVYEANGQAYEDLFTKVMVYSRAGFKSVKPQGQFGDRKNDGFESDLGRYFQVFAPENIKISQADAIKKIKDDFAGLHKHWQAYDGGVKEFYFVLNDKYKGAYPSTHLALNELTLTYPELKISSVFSCSDLEDELFKLSDDQIMYIVGGFIDPDNIATLDYGILNEVLTHINGLPDKPFEAGKLVAPIMNEKIQFNGLKATKGLLENAWHQCGAVDDYFKNESDFAKTELRDKLNGFYIDAKTKFTDADQNMQADLIFIEILSNLIPPEIDIISSKLYKEAASIIMAAYFESCDIFAEPISQSK